MDLNDFNNIDEEKVMADKVLSISLLIWSLGKLKINEKNLMLKLLEFVDKNLS